MNSFAFGASASFSLSVLLLAGSVAQAEDAKNLVPLELKLPSPGFKGTPKDIQLSSYVEPLSDKPRPAMLVPAGLSNLAPGKKLTSSDKNATADTLGKVIDGDKEASDQSIIFLRKGTQWVQMDLGAPKELFAIVLWHAHNSAKVYHDVVVQASDDPDFVKDVKVLYNNDQDNTSGLGVGTDREYFENFDGRLINAKGVKSQYIRFYSKGSTESSLNEYTEVEVYGR
ncbi:MAG: discoidin domain-containing protein [Verrucomicrobiota bacterium]